MKEKLFQLLNKGMNRDLSVSKVGQSNAYDNHNVRIISVDNDTTFSVVNEKGTTVVQIPAGDFSGSPCGWNVIGDSLILFTHQESSESPDYIYRIELLDDPVSCLELYNGNFGFSMDHPIESVVQYEANNLQKIYWVDGVNPLRFADVTNTTDHLLDQGSSNDRFDVNKSIDFGVRSSIKKDNSGVSRQSGVIQYFLTYYDKYGRESGFAWASDLVYLSPLNRGGEADETNTNCVYITLTGLATGNRIRLYSIFRGSLDGQPVGKLVSDTDISTASITIVDNGAGGSAIDVTELLYKGGAPVIPETLTYKDDTLFIGNLSTNTYQTAMTAIKTYISSNFFNTASSGNRNWEAKYIDFVYSDDEDVPEEISSIDICGNPVSSEYYYDNLLSRTSSQITTFKSSEKYRFALRFQFKDGYMSEAVWIGDKTNTKYPGLVDSSASHPGMVNNYDYIRRAIAECSLPEEFITDILSNSEYNIKSVQLLIAEATYSDRSVLAQGFINPTVFNVWERYNERTYSIPSWISRPKNSSIASRHFEAIRNSTSSAGEIQCNYWDGVEPKFPFYKVSSSSYSESFEGIENSGYKMLLVEMMYSKVLSNTRKIFGNIIYIYVDNYSADDIEYIQNYTIPDIFTSDEWSFDDDSKSLYVTSGGVTFRAKIAPFSGKGSRTGSGSDAWEAALEAAIGDAYADFISMLTTELGETNINVSSQDFESYADAAVAAFGPSKFFSHNITGASWDTFSGAANIEGSSHQLSERWTVNNTSQSVSVTSDPDRYYPAYYKKNLMFIDENLITFDSPEIAYGAVSIDSPDYKFRVVGAAKFTGITSDYTVDADPGKYSAENLVSHIFSGTVSSGKKMAGLTAWPLWKEEELVLASSESANKDVKDRTSADYKSAGGGAVNYWLYMWNRPGVITGFTETNTTSTSSSSQIQISVRDNEVTNSFLRTKVFANLHYSPITIFSASPVTYNNVDIRLFDSTSSRLTSVTIAGEAKYYDGAVNCSLSMPGKLKYPILYSSSNAESANETTGSEAKLYSSTPVQISFLTKPHAVISLGSSYTYTYNSDHVITGVSEYTQSILPVIGHSAYGSSQSYYNDYTKNNDDSSVGNQYVPWITKTYSDCKYKVSQTNINVPSLSVNTDSYLLIGEVYRTAVDGDNDTRYGGTTESAIKNCRFIPTSRIYSVAELADALTVLNENTEDAEESESTTNTTEVTIPIYGTQGDTYFQRWDQLRVMPYAKDAVNQVIDITSVMLESHLNLDGRTDKSRTIKQIASIDVEKYGEFNPVYSQTNNFLTARVGENDAPDGYSNMIAWSLQKHNMEDVDAWSHITLANTLPFDGDLGEITALRRYKNSILAFQNKAISEVLFNSRTQISTSDGMPIELSNSGKVDGKRYITNNYGCLNKWSIVEGKKALYFVDNINKAFCAFNGSTIENLSTKFGMNVWFREHNNMSTWKPNEEDSNIAAYYDKILSDVYLTYNFSDCKTALVFNEDLDAFMSFFDYTNVGFMTNLGDDFYSWCYSTQSVSQPVIYKHRSGSYSLYGELQPYWVTYRVAPDFTTDKIWTNIDYRADFYKTFDGTTQLTTEETLIDGGYTYNAPEEEETVGTYTPGSYMENETFSSIKVWNEYQRAESTPANNPRDFAKKFRIWHYTIPRAQVTESNKYGLDRIRNPWLFVNFKKIPDETSRDYLMQFHDAVIKYYE